jgi:hypothetical protein
MGEREAGLWERERREYGRERGRNLGEGGAGIWERERQDYPPD